MLRLLNPSIAGFRFIYREIFYFFFASAFARDRDDAERDVAGEVIGDGLNAHSKFRLNGISIHTEHVPKGNLLNVAPVSGRRYERGVVFGRFEVIGQSGGGRTGADIMRNEIVTIIVRECVYVSWLDKLRRIPIHRDCQRPCVFARGKLYVYKR